MFAPPAMDVFSMEYDSLYDSGCQTPVKNNIDYSKFKTKLCRNFLMGLACPFENRCAFAHSLEEQAQGRAMAVPLTPTIPSPPSYQEFVAVAGPESLSDSAASSRPNTPPAYPSRFRYEPYSQAGIIFAH